MMLWGPLLVSLTFAGPAASDEAGLRRSWAKAIKRSANEILQQPAAKLPWGHHMVC